MTALKSALEDLLRARRLLAEAPLLRGEARRPPLPTGIPVLDALFGGGLSRGEAAELYGPASSGRTGVALALVARTTRGGGLAAWLDPADRLDPDSVSAAGVELQRLLWLRGAPPGLEPLPAALAALGTLLDAALFDLVVFDLAGLPAAALGRVPGNAWVRLRLRVESTARAALLLLGTEHLPHAARFSLALDAAEARWSGAPGSGRLFQGLEAQAHAGDRAERFALQAVH